jgi:hypothetical protein
VHGVIAAGASSSAWSFGSSILTFAFPMILFVVVACGLYVAYTKPELVPGHRNPAVRHSVSYTAVPGHSQAAVRDQATSDTQAAPDTQATSDTQAMSDTQATSDTQAAVRDQTPSDNQAAAGGQPADAGQAETEEGA